MLKVRNLIPKVITLLLAVVSSGTASAQSDLFRLQTKSPVAAPAAVKPAASIGSKTAYAWVTRDRSGVKKGIVSFDISKPDSLTSEFPLADQACAGTYGAGKYYFYRFRNDTVNETMQPLAFSSVDLKTGAVTDIADWSSANFICNDMAYDYTEGVIYAMCRKIYTDEDLNFDIEHSSLIKINPSNGTYSTVKDFISDYSGLSNPIYLTLACDLNGTLYSINISGQLVTFDKRNDYAQKIIGSTGFAPGQYLQCMDFDHGNEKLYWAADYKKRVSNFVLVDTKTGQGTEVGNLGHDSRIAGLYIPFDMPDETAPAAATDFTVTPAEKGALSATLSWTNPTKTFGNAELTSISKVKVLRAGKVIKEFDNVTPGQSLTYVDDAVPSNGLYEYSIVATNATGDGKSAVQESWVGRDVPAAVTKLGVSSNDDGSAKLTWIAPAKGAHDGWIDSTSLSYKITRYPGEVAIADNVKALEYTDNTIDTLGEHYYIVQSKSTDGEGGTARSAAIYLGKEATLPYACNFDTEGQFASWLVIDNNHDESTWTYKKSYIAGKLFNYAMYGYNSKNAGDDYLISPAFNFKKGHTYTLSFSYRGANANYTETFDVTLGKERTVAGQSNVIKSYSVKSSDDAVASVDFDNIDSNGKYYFSFHATSPKGQYNLYIWDIKLVDKGGAGEVAAPYDLKAEVGSDGNVTLSWNDNAPGTSENINEDFESYQGFQINPTGKYKWNYIDGDGCIPFYTFEDGFTNAALKQPAAAIIIDSTLCNGSLVTRDDPPYSGTKYLMFRGTSETLDGSRPVPAPSDYFISPKLNYSSNFTFSFYAKSDPDSYETDESWKWNKEQMRVGYSVSGKDSTDFVWLTEKNETVNDTWAKHSYIIPAEAKYVCIHYCTPTSGYLMCVDNVFIGIEGASNLPLRAPESSSSFVVYLDGDSVGTTDDTSYILRNVSAGSHTASVTAVLNGEESEPATVTFVVPEKPSTAVEGIENASAAKVFDIYTIDGILVRRQATSFDGLKRGVYIANGKKLIVK